MAELINFEYESNSYAVRKDGLLDMRIYDAVAEYGDGHPLTVRAMGIALFGRDGYARLERDLADDSGHVPVEELANCVLSAVEAASAKN